MPEPVAFYSSVAFDAQELVAFVRSFHIEGARIYINEKPRPGYPNDAQIVRGADQFVNISLSNDMFEEGRMEEETLEQIKQHLGSEPKTCVILDVGKHNRSDRLGLEIASLFLEHWPGVIDALRLIEHRYLTRADILALYEKGYGFDGRPIFVLPRYSRSPKSEGHDYG